jgi:class 3 adenylate cyclase/ligand-binding sensor domain-containing protein
MRNLILLCCLLRMCAAQAQGDVQIKVYDREAGLSHRLVSHILQDSAGYIWLATINGLNRFDGHEFVHYGPTQTKAYLPQAAYSGMATDGQRLWLGSPNYMTRFDPQRNHHEVFKIKEGELQIREAVVPSSLTLGSNGQVWAAAYQEQSARTKLLRMQSDGQYEALLELEGAYIGRPMLQVGDRLYLGASGNELWVIGPKGELLEKWALPVAPQSHIVQIQALAGKLYLLCVDGQLFTFDLARQAFSRHPASGSGATAKALMIEPDGSLWIGGRGLLLHYDAKRGSKRNFAPEVEQATKNTVTFQQLFRDRSDVVWAASDFGAVRLVPSAKLFQHYLEDGSKYCSNIYCSTRGICEDEEGRIYFSYYNSIHVLDPQADRLRPLFPFSDFFNSPFGLSYHDGALYTGNGKRIDLETLQVEDILQQPNQDIGHAIPSSDGHIWIGYLNNLYRYEPKRRRLSEFEDSQGKWDSLSGNISCLHEGQHSGRMWAGTLDNGLHLLHKKQGRIAHYHTGADSPLPLRHNQVNALYEDPKRRLWIGTGAGLHCLSPSRDSLHVYTTEDGLPNDFINGILPEGDSCLWVSTDNGLSRFSLRNGTFTNYFQADGLSANEFNRISAYRARDGRLYFGGLNGVNAFYPGPEFAARKQVQRQAPLLFTQFSKYDAEQDTLLLYKHGLDPAQAITIAPGDRMFTFGFALADYQQPQDNLYSYQLEGYEKDWSLPSTEHSARYNNIPAGSYTFRVRAKAGPHHPQWNDQELVIPIVVQEAFHQTLWFWLAAAALLIGAVFGIMRWRVILARRRSRELALLVQQRTQELEREKQKSEELLLNILPAETAEELKRFGFAKAKRHELVTVMFSDFKGFSRISERMDPEDLVAEIDHCFCAFDEIMEKYGLEKIKTVGDAYLCVGGMKNTEGDEAVRATLAGLEIQAFMAGLKVQRTAENRSCFEARIGIHTGPLVAGIVGIKKFAYDIWGDTVNLAARMETNGEVGKVNVSEATYAFIKDFFHCEHHGQYTETDGDNIDMYFVGEYLGD